MPVDGQNVILASRSSSVGLAQERAVRESLAYRQDLPDERRCAAALLRQLDFHGHRTDRRGHAVASCVRALLAGPRGHVAAWWHTYRMVFVAEAFGSWLIGKIADVGCKRVSTWTLGKDQERALRQVADAAIRLSAEEFYPGDPQQAVSLGMVIEQVFAEPIPPAPLADDATTLEAIQAGIAAQLAPLDDAELTETGRSSAEVIGIAVPALTQKLTRNLVREIVTRGSRDGPLAPLADQLNHDMTHLQNMQIDGKIDQIASIAQATFSQLQNLTSTDARAVRDLRSTLRSRNWSFTGREDDIASLSAEPRGRTVLTQGLVGLGGIGKSALALEYAHRQLATGKVDLAWWFIAEERLDLLASMARLYGQLTGTEASGAAAEAGAVALRNWLEQSPYNWVLVFDNAEPAALNGILPENGTGQVIITSRTRDWHDVAVTRMIRRLPPEDAVTLLTKSTGLPADDDARQVAEELGGLALAIEQAAAYIRQTHTSSQNYLDALRSDPTALYESDLAHSESVAARVWRRSLEHVTSGNADHSAAIVLGVLSYLAPDNIPRQLLQPGAVEKVPLLHDLGTVQLTLALAELAAYSLIRLEPGSLSVHRLIQHITRLDADARGCAADYCAAAVGLLAASMKP